jgi:2-dehydro-3-deoxygalactonokinase
VPQPRLVALDWGTTSLRAWLFGDGARILDSRRRARGLQGTASDDREQRTSAYKRAFDEAVGDWLRANPTLPVLGCRMVG